MVESTQPRSLIPTVGSALGMLVGGAAAAGLGTLLASERAVVVGYAVGAVGGAVVGGVLGYRWLARKRVERQPDQQQPE